VRGKSERVFALIRNRAELRDVRACQVNGDTVLTVEYDIDAHCETVYDHQHNELLLLHYDAAGRVLRVIPRTHLDALSVTYDRHGRWTQWSRGDLTVSRVFDEATGRLVERRLGSTTAYRYVYKNTSKASQCSWMGECTSRRICIFGHAV